VPDAALVRHAIERALKARRHYSGRGIRDIAFHMTDWLHELSKLCAFFEVPDRLKPREVEELLLAFLIHAPNHVAAASKLMTGVPVRDVFDVGAVDTERGRPSGRRRARG
jgi:hypothetical protein